MKIVEINTPIKRDGNGRFIKGYKVPSPGTLGMRFYNIPKIDLERFYIDEKQSMKEVSERYGCSIPTVENRLNEYEITIRTNGESRKGKITIRKGRFEIPLPSKEVLEQLYIGEKLSCSEIAKRYKCNAGIVRNRLKYFEIPRRDRNLAVKLAMSGKNNNNWKNGITPIHNKIRNSFEYRLWKSDVFHRDNFTCQECGKRGNGTLHAHHIKSFSSILQYYEITTIKEALDCEEFWNINNGITLCKKCHVKVTYE